MPLGKPLPSVRHRRTERPWGDANREPQERVKYLLAHLTIEEKISQLVGLWVVPVTVTPHR